MDVTSEDLYDMLGVEQTSNVQEIKKAYRKKALTCHPDKNPDNPETVQLFLRLSKALEILIDETARTAYDKILNARKEVQRRHKTLDTQRKKFKEELEKREQAAESSSRYFTKSTQSEEERLKSRIDFLRREGSKQLQEEVEYIKKELYARMTNPYAECRVKVHWNIRPDDKQDNEAYSKESLHSIFSKYGHITALVVSQKKKGSALIEFSSTHAVVNAIKERGSKENPLKVELLSTANRYKRSKVSAPKFSSPPNTATVDQNTNNDIDEFEANVLGLLKQAQERKTLIENIQNEESFSSSIVS